MTLRRYLPVAVVVAGSVALGVGLWLLAGLAPVLIVFGAAAVVLGLRMEV